MERQQISSNIGKKLQIQITNLITNIVKQCLRIFTVSNSICINSPDEANE